MSSSSWSKLVLIGWNTVSQAINARENTSGSAIIKKFLVWLLDTAKSCLLTDTCSLTKVSKSEACHPTFIF